MKILLNDIATAAGALKASSDLTDRSAAQLAQIEDGGGLILDVTPANEAQVMKRVHQFANRRRLNAFADSDWLLSALRGCRRCREDQPWSATRRRDN